MNRWMRKLIIATAFFIFAVMQTGYPVQAKAGNTVENGIYVGQIDVSGKSEAEVKQVIETYIEELKQVAITWKAVGDKEVSVSVGELGLSWTNPEVVDEAICYGKKGNVVQRYKTMQDLRYENKVFELKYDLDKGLIREILNERCSGFNVEAIDATLTRADGKFSIIPGQTGQIVDEDASIQKIYEYILNDWNYEPVQIELAIIKDEPKGSEEELAKVQDVLGTFSTSYTSSGYARSENIANGCELISGVTVYPGDEFSTYKEVAPFTESNGYYMAGSYLNGQVVDSLGGGICQVSTTLYNVVLLAELDVTERHNHSMIVSYVDPSADAAIAESAGKDFRFVNNTGYPIYVEGKTVDKVLTFTIYGVEMRDYDVSYESEVLSVIGPESEVIHTDPAMPLGQVITQSAHIGYKAKLWKVITKNGVEISREEVNSSSYKMVPRTATVGLSTNDVNAYNEIMAAVSTNNIDHVKNVAAGLTQLATPDIPPVEEQQIEPVEQPAE